MSGQGNHIKSFDTIRPRLRRILAGLSLGGRPESGDRILWTRVRHFLEDEKVYNVRRIGRRRITGLRTDRYRGSTNYLITLYRSKTFAPRRLAILLLVLQLLGTAPSGLPMQSLLEEVQRRIPQVPKKRREDVSEDGSQTARELCTRLKDLGIVRTSGHTTQCVWQIADDALGGLTAGELDALLAAIGFYKNVAPLGAYGYFLESTLRSRYAQAHPRAALPHIPAQFLHAGMTRLIDEEIVQRALDARRTRRLLVLTYCGRRGSSEGEIYHLWPLRIEEDVWQGNRQTLVGILYEPRRAARASAHGDATAAGGEVWWDRRSHFPLDRVTDAVLGDPLPSAPPEAPARERTIARLRVYATGGRYARLRQDIAARYEITDEQPAEGGATCCGRAGAAHDLTIAADDPWTLVPFIQEHAPDLALTDAPAPIRARLAENLRAALANYGKEAAPDGGEA